MNYKNLKTLKSIAFIISAVAAAAVLIPNLTGKLPQSVTETIISYLKGSIIMK